MKIALFCHSLLSDWNHGNAHFLRGIVTELAARGHDVVGYEAEDAWSARCLEAGHGTGAFDAVRARYPALRVVRYDPATLDLDAELDGVGLVLVHEWNPPALVRRIGRHRRRRRYTLFFHDTHHRSVSEPEAMAAYDLEDYDGVLAFGTLVRDRYVRAGWAARAWTWHEAADTRVFRPVPWAGGRTDLVWVGNWGDEERTAELAEYLIEPVRTLRLRATVHGVRYPAEAVSALRAAGLRYEGWLPNFEVPGVFARHRVTVHVPRRPYARALRGIPTIRPFEALACGIPLVSARWDDVEGLFTAGQDYLVASNGPAMRRHLRSVLMDAELAGSLASSGRRAIEARHTCAHRVDELFAILRAVAAPAGGTDAVPAGAGLGSEGVADDREVRA